MKSTALLFALLSATVAAGAADVGQHPAVFSPRSLPGIDASTFIPGHPAGGAPGRAPVEVAAEKAPSGTAKSAAEVTKVSAAKTDLPATTRQ